MEDAEKQSKASLEKDAVIASLQSEIAALRAASPSEGSSDELSLLRETVRRLNETIQQLNERYAVLEQEQEDLLLCLADQEAEMDGLRAKLRLHGGVADDDYT
jgi:hypothetical protein